MSYYLELAVMFVMYVGWKVFKKTKIVGLGEMDLESDVHTISDVDLKEEREKTKLGKVKKVLNWIF